VEISSLADGVTGSAAASSARQASRVQQLAQLYSSGRYEVDASKVSQALVADALGRGSEPKAGA
jgi:anti-sigma28 factor (negative regulator of flagellin synthesis)